MVFRDLIDSVSLFHILRNTLDLNIMCQSSDVIAGSLYADSYLFDHAVVLCWWTQDSYQW